MPRNVGTGNEHINEIFIGFHYTKMKHHGDKLGMGSIPDHFFVVAGYWKQSLP